MALSTLLLSLSLLAHAALGTPALSGSSSVQQLYDSLTDQEKEYFIRYHLGKAVSTQHSARLPADVETEPAVLVPQHIQQKIEDVSKNLPTDFPNRLYELVTTQYDLTYKQVRTLVRSGQVCNANGVCLYPKDVGSSCCPF
ncbi:uncharacterized protein LOC134535051 [Bacillus rossius redtenbacheri]|uniref:uncharacterized protein LOC134535051 n=1 Tax=Bacillus rossius redtenbacheri TaxID=93214 RepID=UPI002FDCB100